MTDRVRIRVTPHGGETSRELMVDNVKVCDLSFYDVIVLAGQTLEGLKAAEAMSHEQRRKAEYVMRVDESEIDMSFIEAIEFAAQAASSLRF